MHRTSTRFALILLATSVAAACSRTETTRTETAAPAATTPGAGGASNARVTDVEVGRTINPDKTIKDKADNFAPADTIYVSVKTEGAAQGAKLQTRWYFNDKVVEESSEMISPTGPAVTEFHLSKPDGWPVGNYKIEVLMNGTPSGSKSFEVKPTAS
jgi:hypothetical protein